MQALIFKTMILTHHVLIPNGKVNFVNGENTKVVVEDGDNACKITVNAKTLQHQLKLVLMQLL